MRPCQRRSLIFKKMQIVRGCDPKRNVLVYLVYTDKIIEGSPENSTSAVADQPVERAGRAGQVRGLGLTLTLSSTSGTSGVRCVLPQGLEGLPGWSNA